MMTSGLSLGLDGTYVGRRQLAGSDGGCVLVRLQVLAEMIAAHEALAAYGTREALLPCMSTQMTLQLVGAREALAAEEPVAEEGPFARVPAEVSAQV